jgi:hypothetical protein
VQDVDNTDGNAFPDKVEVDLDMLCTLGARAGDGVLTLGGPGDEVVVEEHIIARGGPACIRANRPACIRVDH